ncbi:MAG: peptidoglycan DD-metalloendopeptidase family protein [Pseudomonadota bacterium]
MLPPGSERFWQQRTAAAALLALCTLLLFPLAALAQAADQEQLERERAEVRQALKALQTAIRRDEAELETEARALREVEQALAQTRRALRRSEERIKTQESRLQALEEEAARRAAQLGERRRELTEAVQLAYRRGRNPELKAVLSVSDAADGARQLYYFRQVQRVVGERTARLIEQLRDLAIKQAEVRAARTALAAERDTLSATRGNYEQQQAARQAALATLNNRLRERRATGNQLEADETRLDQLIRDLQSLLADIPAPGPGLSTRRGDLPLPVDGRILRGPGQRKPAGLHRFGMLIEADAGDPVYAVSYGRVAYADWLRGFGLLTIVDHGDDYLTLYAFNESLFREVGDWVGAGDLIAAAGASGGQSQSGLYFELRKAGEPVDPRPWLRNLDRE